MQSEGVAGRTSDAREPRDARRRGGSPALDSVSLAIIEQLQEDGRRPYAAIGKAVGLSEAAVRQRVQKLLDQGMMQIVAVTDPLTVGFRRQAMVGITVEGALDPVAEALTAMSEVEYVVLTAGSFDLLVEIVCEDDDHLLEVISDRIRALPGVRSTESFVYLKLKKQTYMWGTR
ncbi:Lrp/AsnC family transcriptional regulator [Streptomyces sp. NPDC050560]|uniref:Lrp/AsnC family transcriptional regulator n=1 Tax=Streptomyces sp. NPDC050560 TaxID=3365630 RepID=UPI0037AD0D36